MRHELSIKQIFDDFVNKMILTDNEKEILIRYIKNESIVEISERTAQSTSSVSRTISDLKTKYEDYRTLEVAKLNVFDKKS